MSQAQHVKPQWGDAMHDLVRAALNSDTFRVFMKNIETMLDATPEIYRPKLKETVSEMTAPGEPTTAETGPLDSVISVTSVAVAVPTLGTYIRLWASGEGYWKYWDASVWKTQDIPLLVFWHIVRYYASDKPSTSSTRVYDTLSEIEESATPDGEWITSRPAVTRTPTNVAPQGPTAQVDRSDARWNWFGTPEETWDEAVRRIALIQRTRNYRCLHPMERASRWQKPSSYLQRRLAAGGVGNSYLANADGLLNGIKDDCSASWDKTQRAAVHGAALAHVVGGAPAFDVTCYFENQPIEAIHGAIKQWPALVHGQAPMSMAITEYLPYNARQLMQWSKENDENPRPGTMLSAREIQSSVTKYLSAKDVCTTESAYMALARAAHDRVAANGLLGVTPAGRMLSQLYHGLAAHQKTSTAPSNVPGSRVMDLMNRVVDSKTFAVRASELDHALSIAAANQHDDSTSEKRRRVVPLVELTVAGIHQARSSAFEYKAEPVPESEAGLCSALLHAPLFATLFYCKPFHPVDIRHAVMHLDYTLSLLYGIAFWSEPQETTSTCLDTPAEHLFGPSLKYVRKHVDDLVSEMYMLALYMDVARFTVHGEEALVDKRRVLQACLQQNWSVFDLMRYAFAPLGPVGQRTRTMWFELEQHGDKRTKVKHTVALHHYQDEAADLFMDVVRGLVKRVRVMIPPTDDPLKLSVLPLCHLHSVLIYMTAMGQATARHLNTWPAWKELLADVTETLRSARRAPHIQRHVKSTSVIVNNMRFVRQCRESGFAQGVFPGAEPRQGNPTSVTSRTVLGVSSHASAMYDLWIAASRINAMHHMPSLAGSYMDSTILPLVHSFEQALQTGAEKWLADSELFKGPQERTLEEWNNPMVSSLPFPRALVMFEPTPSWYSWEHVAVYHGPLEARKVEPDLLVMPHIRSWDTGHPVYGAYYNMQLWQQYAPLLMDRHFMAAPVRVVPHNARLTSVWNHFANSMPHKAATRQSYAETCRDLYFSDDDEVRRFHDFTYSEPTYDRADNSWDAELSRIEPPKRRMLFLDYTLLRQRINQKDPVAVLMRHCMTAYNRVQASGVKHTYKIFNSMLRRCLARRERVDGVETLVWPERRYTSAGAEPQPIDYDRREMRALDVKVYQTLGFVLAVPDAVMETLGRFIITERQRDYFIREHCFDGDVETSGRVDRALFDPHQRESHRCVPRDQHARHILIMSHNKHVMTVHQLLSLNVVANTEQNRYKLCHAEGIVPTQLFVPSSMMHISNIPMEISADD